jgi:hypothetical protein
MTGALCQQLINKANKAANKDCDTKGRSRPPIRLDEASHLPSGGQTWRED